MPLYSGRPDEAILWAVIKSFITELKRGKTGMSAVPKLSRWSTFVRSLGGHVGLDMGWEERAWAEFSDDRQGTVDVVCRLGDDGDLDVTCRPRLEGENIRENPRLAQALAALAYVNPAPSGNGEVVSRDDHRGDWHQIDDDLAVVVAVSGRVGDVEVGGRGAFLVHKGHLWLPNGVQTPRETVPPADTAEPARKNADSPPPEASPVTPLRRAEAGESGGTGVGAVHVMARAARRPVERRARIFGDESDELIQQARSARRRLA